MKVKTARNPHGSGRTTTSVSTYSKLTVRIPEPMLEEIRVLADRDLRALNSFMLVLLDFALEHYPYRHSLKSERLQPTLRPTARLEE